VTAWEWSGNPSEPIEHREKLEYEVVHFATRSYK
jgi:succinate dehydrogenase / fumarate reductase flavoprotein subunit